MFCFEHLYQKQMSSHLIEVKALLTSINTDRVAATYVYPFGFVEGALR
jgi:hypothetical protein